MVLYNECLGIRLAESALPALFLQCFKSVTIFRKRDSTEGGVAYAMLCPFLLVLQYNII